VHFPSGEGCSTSASRMHLITPWQRPVTRIPASDSGCDLMKFSTPRACASRYYELSGSAGLASQEHLPVASQAGHLRARDSSTQQQKNTKTINYVGPGFEPSLFQQCIMPWTLYSFTYSPIISCSRMDPSPAYKAAQDAVRNALNQRYLLNRQIEKEGLRKCTAAVLVFIGRCRSESPLFWPLSCAWQLTFFFLRAAYKFVKHRFGGTPTGNQL
jgi:hypothetical protein